MTQLPEHPQTSISSPEAQQAIGLLRYYGFDLLSASIEEQMADWLDRYPTKWVLQAIVEALYQGRYKAVSVNQILAIWQRRGQPLCHFNHEFERIVGGNLTAIVHVAAPQAPEQPAPALPTRPTLSYREMLQELPSARVASKLKRLTEIPTLKLSRISIQVPEPEMNGIQSEQAGSYEEPDSPLALDQEVDPDKFNFDPIELPPSADFSLGWEQADQPVNPLANFELPRVNESETVWSSEGREAKPEGNPDREFKEFKEGVVFALSSGLAASALQPRMRLLLSRLYQIDWLQFCTTPKAIDQFIPTLEASEFHRKLKTVAEPEEPAQE
jgi:hypothetical protein